MIMKIEELSIGNYIKRKPYYNHENGDICKVLGLNKEQADFVLTDKKGWENMWGNLNNFEPVYIKDVIDKLGFKKVTDGGFDYYQIFSDYYADIRMEEFETGLGHYVIKATAINDEFNFPSEIIITSQLHDLQNFLTKTQINIKIEL